MNLDRTEKIIDGIGFVFDSQFRSLDIGKFSPNAARVGGAFGLVGLGADVAIGVAKEGTYGGGKAVAGNLAGGYAAGKAAGVILTMTGPVGVVGAVLVGITSVAAG